MALTDFFEPFAMMDRITHEDDLAGIVHTWQEGAHFRAGITTKQSTQARIAYQDGAKVMYTIVIPETMDLQKDDRVKRLSDGLFLRITSNAQDMTTPAAAQMKFRQVTAEAIQL